MIIETKEATVESSMDFGDSINMGIAEDAEGIKHLMSLLTNLYNDPELAVIREYYTNALDAHVEVGQTQPVDIYLPTRENPLYVVKDYGVGMSREDIAKIYSQYGASTKRKTNKQVGAFGLGCKSALTIATQFTLTSVKDGLKTTALISKDESGINKVDILPVRATEEPSGTTVTIPVPNVPLFSDKVLSFFKYSNPENVLLNGRRPDNVYDDSKLLDMPGVDAEVYTRKTKKLSSWSTEQVTFQLVMGSVPYVITHDNIQSSLRRSGVSMDIAGSGTSVVFVIGIGKVDLTPSREGLRYTDKTKEFVDGLLKEYVTTLKAVAQKEIDAVDTRGAVFDMVREWGKVIPMSGATWRGMPIKYQMQLTTTYPNVERFGSSANHTTSNSISTSRGLTIVTGSDVKEYRKLSKWLGSYVSAEPDAHSDFLFIPDLDTAGINDEWITENSWIFIVKADDMVAKAKEYRKEQRALARAANTEPAPKQTYPVLNLKTHMVEFVPYDEIDHALPYLNQARYDQGSEVYTIIRYPRSNGKVVTRVAKALSAITDAPKVIFLESPRKGSALEKRVPGSYDMATEFQKLYEKLKAVPIKQSVRDYVAVAAQYNDFKVIMEQFRARGLHTDIPDPDLRRMLNPKRKDVMTYKRLSEARRTLKMYAPASIGYDVDLSLETDLFERLSKKYPLIDKMYVRNMHDKEVEHTALYIKAVAQHDQKLISTP